MYHLKWCYHLKNAFLDFSKGKRSIVTNNCKELVSLWKEINRNALFLWVTLRPWVATTNQQILWDHFPPCLGSLAIFHGREAQGLLVIRTASLLIGVSVIIESVVWSPLIFATTVPSALKWFISPSPSVSLLESTTFSSVSEALLWPSKVSSL